MLTAKEVWMNLAYSIYIRNHDSHEPGQNQYVEWHPYIKECSVEGVAKSYFYHSFWMVRRSCVLEALCFLRLALRAWPGWPAAVELVDEIDRRMQRESVFRAEVSNPFQ